MKVVFFFFSFANPGGIERVVTDRMNYMADHLGYEVHLVTYDQGCHSCAFPLSERVVLTDMGTPFWPLFRVNRLKRFWKRWKLVSVLQQRFDALMAQLQPDLISTTAGLPLGMKIVARCPVAACKLLESHCDRDNEFFSELGAGHDIRVRLKAVLYRLQRHFYERRFDRLVALTHADAQLWQSYLPTTVIPNVVSLNTTGQYSDHSAKQAIFAGRIVYQKGLDVMIRIWRLVNQRHPDWSLELYGDGDLKASLMALAERLQANVHFHPSTADIHRRYIESSFFVLTSHYEAFGLVMPEAMSCGLPVVAFDCPFGPAEIIADGVDGFLVGHRDMAAYVDRVCQLIESRELRQCMGQAAILSAQRYSAERVMPLWKALLESR